MSPPPSGPAPRAPRVLVVDDEPIMLRTMRRVLGRAHPDWQIVTVLTGAEALEVLEQMPCDVIITDLVLAGSLGQDLLVAVRETHPCVVRVIHSGELDTEHSHPAEDLAHLVIVKPATSDELIETVSTAMSLARGNAARCAGRG